MRSEEEASRAIDLYGDTVKRICMLHLKNYSDTEDIFQTVFLKYVLHAPVFDSSEHERAWIIRVTINACKDLLKSFFRSRTLPLDSIIEKPGEPDSDYSDVLEAVLSLPPKYKDVVYLYYYEEYSAAEISRILHKNVNTVYTLLNRGRQALKTKLEEVDEHGK
ncbi:MULTISPECIES: RNA polymerase sigma factor [unclassified Blautia]|uniref:RNA polymerase sigma factor n=1 Tax=unclassified Blautia TaxID=2648079 RepID=UPI000B393C3F|nr:MULTISPECIES: RNA polymerase sigma factor [unclassified Blautia]OUN26676.1 RNA polymerase subunit sigma-24 [Blautia sp. An81]OUN91415.1 RNA polymerase subunit sigma-24 [Blautia sp. An46]HJD36947.1 RNA polymerase sigma factor [Candidatus Blautia ornithocaccae]